MNNLYGEYATVSLARPVSMPDALQARGKWSKVIRDAGVVWRRLTEGDLARLEDREDTLAALLRERYGVSREEADRQVTTFIEDHQSFSL